MLKKINTENSHGVLANFVGTANITFIFELI